MATNEVFRNADHLTLPVPANTVAGDPVHIGGLVGVAVTSRDADGNATVWLKGAFNLTVADAITVVGQPVYAIGDGTTRFTSLTNSASGNTLFGHALATKTATAAAIPVRIAQV